MTISFTGKLRLLAASSAARRTLEALTAPLCPFQVGAEKKVETRRKESEGGVVPQYHDPRV